MTLQEAKSIVRHLGLTLRKVRSGDYCVRSREGNEPVPYYTDDLEDAVNAAVRMARKASVMSVTTLQPESRRSPAAVNTRLAPRSKCPHGAKATSQVDVRLHFMVPGERNELPINGYEIRCSRTGAASAVEYRRQGRNENRAARKGRKRRGMPMR